MKKKLSMIEQRRLAGRKSAEARGKKGSKKYIAYYKKLSAKGVEKRWAVRSRKKNVVNTMRAELIERT